MRLYVLHCMHSSSTELRSDGRKSEFLGIMEMLSRHILLFFLSLIFQTSSLHLVDHPSQKLRSFLERKNNHLSHLEPKSQKFDLSRQTEESGRRGNGNESKKNGSFVKCVFKVNSNNMPDYDCKHSENVKINWTREDGRLMGTFSTSFRCPERRDVRNKMQSPQNKVGGIWKQLIRGKRRTVYRDDAEAENAQEENAQQIEGNENDVPEVNQDVTEGEDDIEDSQESRLLDGGDKEDPGGEEDSVEGEKEVNQEVEESTNDDDDDKDNQEEEGNESDSENNQEEPIAETSSKEENDDNTNDNEKNDEKEKQTNESNDKKTDDDEEGNDDSNSVEENNEDKEDKDNITETPSAEAGNDNDDEIDSILVPIQVDIELILTESELQLVMQLIEELLDYAGDYLLYVLMRNLKQRLHHGRIEENFNRKVEILSKSHGNDTGKALLLMKKKIHEQFGKSFQLEIVKYLQQLYAALKL